MKAGGVSLDASLKIIRLLWLLSGKEHATVTCYLLKEMQRKDIQTLNVTLNLGVCVCVSTSRANHLQVAARAVWLLVVLKR